LLGGQVYVKAKECTEVVSMEEFAVILGRHFTSLYPQVRNSLWFRFC
jgi:urate oxidase